MTLPTQKTKIVAATPIKVGELRLLPSVLINTLSYEGDKNGECHMIKMRPISIVEEGSQETRWIEIPNSSSNALSMMAVAGLGIAAVSIALIFLLQIVRGE